MAVEKIQQDTESSTGLSRRQGQIMEVLFEHGEASAEEIRARMTASPSNSAVRATLKIMEDRGLVVRTAKDLRYVYRPKETRGSAQASAIHRLIKTFFDNSAEQATLALLGETGEQLSSEQLDRIQKMIEQAKERSRS
jgi:predicted transcriptional regulator